MKHAGLKTLVAVIAVGGWFAGHRFLADPRFDGPSPAPVQATPEPPSPPPEPPKASAEVFQTVRAVAIGLELKLKEQPQESLTPEERTEVLRYVSGRMELARAMLEVKRLPACIQFCDEVLRVDADFALARELKMAALGLRYRPEGFDRVAAKFARWTLDADALKLPTAERWAFLGRHDDPEKPETMELYDVRDLTNEGSGGAFAARVRWAVGPADSLEFHRGVLIVTARPDVHEQIAAFLAARRAGN